MWPCGHLWNWEFHPRNLTLLSPFTLLHYTFELDCCRCFTIPITARIRQVPWWQSKFPQVFEAVLNWPYWFPLLPGPPGSNQKQEALKACLSEKRNTCGRNNWTFMSVWMFPEGSFWPTEVLNLGEFRMLWPGEFCSPDRMLLGYGIWCLYKLVMAKIIHPLDLKKLLISSDKFLRESEEFISILYKWINHLLLSWIYDNEQNEYNFYF